MIKCISCLCVFDKPLSNRNCPVCGGIHTIKYVYPKRSAVNIEKERIVGVDDLAHNRLRPIAMNSTLEMIVGRLSPSHLCQWGGPQGSGKTTALWAAVASSYALNGKVLYNSLEQHFSITLTEILQREEIFGSNLSDQIDVTVNDSAVKFFNALKDGAYSYGIIDSISVAASDLHPDDLDKLVRETGVGLSYSIHSLKDHKTYKGDSAWGHLADVVVWLPSYGKWETVKNRFSPCTSGVWREGISV